jgi:hypothetical protein
MNPLNIGFLESTDMLQNKQAGPLMFHFVMLVRRTAGSTGQFQGSEKRRTLPKAGRAKEARLTMSREPADTEHKRDNRDPQKWNFDQRPVRPFQSKEKRAPRHVQNDIDCEESKYESASRTVVHNVVPRRHARPSRQR